MKPLRFLLTLALAMVSAIVGLMACDDNPTTELCLLTGRDCIDGDGGSSGATRGDTGTASPCTANPAFEKPCDNNTGTNVCAPNGVDLVCSHSPNGSGNDGGSFDCSAKPNGEGCTTLDNKPGVWGCSWDARLLVCYPLPPGSPPPPPPPTKDGGAPPSTCNRKPNFGQPCSYGVGVCQNNGFFICNERGDDVRCTVSGPKPATSSTDICGNGLDDNCNGVPDEEPGCTNPSNDAGAGDSGATPDAGGPPDGGATCTFAPVGVNILAEQGATTLLKGQNTVTSIPVGNVWSTTLSNNDLLSISYRGRLAILRSALPTVPVFSLNYWEPATGTGADPVPLINDLFCRQLGITPITPTTCSATVVGNKSSAAYHSGLRIDWECWRKGAAFCPSTLAGYILPRDLFALEEVLTERNSMPSHTGPGLGVLEAPSECR